MRTCWGVESEDGCSKGYFIALVKNLVFQQTRKDIIHSSRAAFGGEKIELSDGSVFGQHLLLKVFMDDPFGERQHPVRGWIVVAENGVHHFQKKGVAVHLQRVAHVFKGFPKEWNAGFFGMGSDEIFESFG
ncbi:MAG: hypothetical protein JRE07_09490 [Deltaproteobacteria bacterium]|nr:hypothetical protein [Deltaproteobacteria bacterium]